MDGADITGGGDVVRVVLSGDPNLSHGDRGLTRWFDTSVIKRPGPGDFGNASRLPIRGPGINNWGLTAFKNFPIRGRSALQVRWEVYNLFSARPPRIMQGSLRFTF